LFQYKCNATKAGPTYSSSSKTSSTLGDRFLCDAVEVAIAGAAEVVVAVAGAGWPVIAAMVAPALAEPDCFDFFLPFFFSYFTSV
jgi:hypothetical protein